MNKLFLIAALAAVSLSACDAASSVASAPSRVIVKTMETDNIITSYEWFFDADAQFTARTAQLTQYNGIIAETADPSELSRLRMERAAIAQSCRELATKYNNNSIKLNQEFFKSKKLPTTLDITNCEAR